MPAKTCSVDGCNRPHHSKGYCSPHAHRAARYGDPLAGGTPRIKGRVGPYPSELSQQCSICGERGTAVTPVSLLDDSLAHKACRLARTCEISDCNRPTHTSTLCIHHYNLHYYASNRDRMRERGRRSYAENPDRQRASTREWYWANRMQALAFAHNARAARLGALGVVTAEQLLGRLLVFGSRCYLCGGTPNGFDHVKPLAAGGPNFASNMRPACVSCNARKHHHWPYPITLTCKEIA